MKLQRPLVLLSLLLAASLGAEVLERVVASVNGEIVTLSEFEARQIAALQANRTPTDQVENYLRQNNSRILQEAVDELLLVQRARELEIKIRPEYVSDVVRDIKKENKLDTDAELEDQLRKEGMTLDALKRNIERSILRQEVIKKEVQSRGVVPEKDAQKYYDDHPEKYRHPATLHLLEILVKAEDAELAQSLVARAGKGEDFGSMAKAHSIAMTRASGGDLGNIVRTELSPEIEKAARPLKKGDVSEPIPTEGGLRILKLADAAEETVVPFDTVRADILKQLSQERLAEEYEKYIEGLRKTGSVELKVKDVPVDVANPADLAAPGTTGIGTAPAPVGDPDAEFRTTPQAAPERVVPPGAPEAPKPSPSPH